MDISKTYVAPKSVKDDDMRYDSSIHQWILSNGFISAMEPGVSTNDQVRLALSISSHIYNQGLYGRMNNRNICMAEFLANCTDSGRTMVKKAMTAQLIADSDTSYDSISRVSPIDSVGGNKISRKDIKYSIVCPDAQQIIENSYVELQDGMVFRFNKMVDLGYSMPSDRYERWDY